MTVCDRYFFKKNQHFLMFLNFLEYSSKKERKKVKTIIYFLKKISKKR